MVDQEMYDWLLAYILAKYPYEQADLWQSIEYALSTEYRVDAADVAVVKGLASQIAHAAAGGDKQTIWEDIKRLFLKLNRLGVYHPKCPFPIDYSSYASTYHTRTLAPV